MGFNHKAGLPGFKRERLGRRPPFLCVCGAPAVPRDPFALIKIPLKGS